MIYLPKQFNQSLQNQLITKLQANNDHLTLYDQQQLNICHAIRSQVLQQLIPSKVMSKAHRFRNAPSPKLEILCPRSIKVETQLLDLQCRDLQVQR